MFPLFTYYTRKLGFIKTMVGQTYETTPLYKKYCWADFMFCRKMSLIVLIAEQQ